MIVFIDESGLSERPCRARTWAPKGETPVLQYSFSWKQLSVIVGLSAYSAHREHGFHSIVNAVVVSAAEAADMGSSVHDEIDNRRTPAMT